MRKLTVSRAILFVTYDLTVFDTETEQTSHETHTVIGARTPAEVRELLETDTKKIIMLKETGTELKRITQTMEEFVEHGTCAAGAENERE